ncbi:MAG: uroporphyrinogen-III C-methyltransferase [Fibrobacterota bacterium]|nr:MAG: uroporphyrinogen-III C-methyltransferase [Fibrobacterota bacterium]
MASKSPLHPIFLDLAGHDVLVVGGGKVGVRKAREFLECGAHLRVVSPAFDPGFADLEGRYQRIERHFRPSDEGGARLVVAATSDPETNRAVYALCSQRGILCNVADVPELCDWQAAAVARKGDVQVAVSTRGQAPSLSGFARRELQNWLADGFSDLVEVFARLREEFRATMELHEREQFWKTVDAADMLDLLRREGAGAVEASLRARREPGRAPVSAKTGRVVLVGAGPGHPDLVTRMGWKVLGMATALVHDRLVAPELVAAVPTSCEVYPVGKTGFGPSHGQADIQALLVRLAQQGHLVVRLKGGDSFVFGRGGEEIEACIEAGIPFEVVPGVSSSLSVPAWRGIPVTHRGISRSFAVISAFHADLTPARIPDVETVVVMMPLHSLGSVRSRFLEAGWDPSTPCAAIQSGTLEGEREVLSTLERIDEDLAQAKLASPILVVVGQVVGWAKEHRELLQRVVTSKAGRHQAQ